MGNRHASYGNVEPGANVEDPAGVIAADDHEARAWSLDVHAFLDIECAAGQCDPLACEMPIEDDDIAVVGLADSAAQRTCTFVEIVEDRQRAEQAAIFKDFKPRNEKARRVLPADLGAMASNPF